MAMRSKAIYISSAVSICLMCDLYITVVKAAPGDVYVNFLARPASAPDASPGHAFVCVDLHLNSGIKEDCFGFYPESSIKAFDGPGIVKNEFKKDAIPNVTVSLAHKISSETRSAIYKKLQEYAGVDYKITVFNCKNLVLDIANVAGLSSGPQGTLTAPVSIVQDLKTKYWNGSWSSNDSAKRFVFEIKDNSALFIENVAGKASVQTAFVAEPKGKLRVERKNDASTLRAIGIQEKYVNQLASSSSPSFIEIERYDNTIIGKWHGLLFTLDKDNNINSVTQPNNVKEKQFNFVRK